jgi:hypothetical protein
MVHAKMGHHALAADFYRKALDFVTHPSRRGDYEGADFYREQIETQVRLARWRVRESAATISVLTGLPLAQQRIRSRSTRSMHAVAHRLRGKAPDRYATAIISSSQASRSAGVARSPIVSFCSSFAAQLPQSVFFSSAIALAPADRL